MVDPATIIAGIRQFGLAPDGSDLRDLEAVYEALERENERLRRLDAASESTFTAWRSRAVTAERQLAEARAEVDGLRAENRELGNEIDNLEEEGCGYDDTVRKLEAERDRLAAVLTEIAGDIDGTWDEKFRAVQSIARAALAGKE